MFHSRIMIYMHMCYGWDMIVVVVVFSPLRKGRGPHGDHRAIQWDGISEIGS